jgi:predicted  nucleic acid-binding Zn-ribbon protein
MPPTITTADSFVASLCREADAARQRGRQLQQCMQRCQDARLFRRLQQELDHLHGRRRDLLHAARSWRRRGQGDALSLDFLIELCSRPLG